MNLGRVLLVKALPAQPVMGEIPRSGAPGETPPTPAQAESGNYAKRTVKWNGLTIKVENPAGSTRRGKGWETRMLFDYGYVARSEGVDGDEVDVYLGPALDTAPTVFVIHQRRAGDWAKYDEDKCMVGFLSEDEARAAYLKHYDDPRFLGPITAMPVAEFVAKVKATKDAPTMIKSAVLFMKTHVEGYTRKDGTVVKPHEDNRRTLYHGSSEHVKEIQNKGLFGGVFASGSLESAKSHGEIVHRIDLPESEIMSQSQIEDVSDDDLKAVAHWVADEDIDRLRELVVDDAQADEDDARIMREDDAGEASWAAQRLRGALAKRAGFKAVEMNDEHGTSYLVLPGAKIEKEDPLAKSVGAAPRILFTKSHVSAYTKKDGTFVAAHDDKRTAAKPATATAAPQRAPVDLFMSFYGMKGDELRAAILSATKGLPSNYRESNETELRWLDALRADPEVNRLLDEAYVKKLAKTGGKGVANLYAALKDSGISVNFDKSRSIGSNSVYLYARKNGKTIKIRLSDHDATQAAIEANGGNDINVRHQNWKSALARAKKLLIGNSGAFDAENPSLTKSMPQILFVKGHVGPYLRGGKLVNVRGYDGRTARAASAPGQLDLFAKPSAPLPPNPFKGKHPVRDTRDMFEDEPKPAPKPGKEIVRTGDPLADYWANSAGESIKRDVDAGRSRVVSVSSKPMTDEEKAKALAAFKARTEESRARKRAAAEDAERAIESGEMPVYVNKSGLTVVITPSAQKPGKFQVTRYNATGAIGDSQYDSVASAVEGDLLFSMNRLSKEQAESHMAKLVGAEMDYRDRKSSATVTESRDKLIAEHERLVGVLESPSHADDKAEAKRQAAELAEMKVEVGEHDHLLADIPDAKWSRGKGVIAGQYGVEIGGSIVGNYHAKPEDAVAEAKQQLAKKAEFERAVQAKERAISSIRERLLSGGEVTDGDLSMLGLRSGSAGLQWFIPAAAKLFGIGSREVRPLISEHIRAGHTDMGAKKEFVEPKKALQSIASAVSGRGRNTAPKVSRVTENKKLAHDAKMVHNEGVENNQGTLMNATQKPVVEKITYKLTGDNVPAKLAGKELEDGVPGIYDGKSLVVFWCAGVGKVSVAVDPRPDLQEKVEKYNEQKAALDAYEEAESIRKTAELKANVPGLEELEALNNFVVYDQVRYLEQFNRMMEDEHNDGVRHPKATDDDAEERLEAMREQFPRAALYLKAKYQAEGASWADNTGMRPAGRAAMEALASGASLDEAKALMEKRREFVD